MWDFKTQKQKEKDFESRGLWIFNSLYRDERYQISSLSFSTFSAECKALRLLEAVNESGTIVCWMCLTLCAFHIKPFHLLPLVKPFIVYVNSNLPQSLFSPCSFSIWEPAALIWLLGALIDLFPV